MIGILVAVTYMVIDVTKTNVSDTSGNISTGLDKVANLVGLALAFLVIVVIAKLGGGAIADFLRALSGRGR